MLNLEERTENFMMTDTLRSYVRDLTKHFVDIPIVDRATANRIIELIRVKHFLTYAEESTIFHYIQGIDTLWQEGKVYTGLNTEVYIPDYFLEVKETENGMVKNDKKTR